MSNGHVFVAMSGGVDSSVAAVLLQQAGYQLSGVNLRMFHNEDLGESPSRTCCSLSDAEDAALVARRLGFPFYVFDFAQTFRDTVIRNFIEEYQQGRTPNPCAECNRSVKFGALLQRVRTLGGDYMATGHYARVERDETSGRYLLKRGKDRSKDQSYFLYMLTQEELAHTLFPLGGMEKSEVRQIAKAHGLVNAKKRDSQDICFVPDGDYCAFMERFTGKRYAPGDYLDPQGQVVGRHQGAVRYTIGQRKGLGLAMGSPVYVCAKDMAANTVTVGPDSALYSGALRANDWNWFPFPELTAPLAVTARIRHSQKSYPAVVYPEAEGSARVEFDAPVRAVTPGQAVVLYQGDLVVGGGTITEAIR